MAIKIASNFETGASEPLDKRQVVSVYADLASITTAYDGLEVWVVSELRKYRYTQNEWVKCNDRGDYLKQVDLTTYQGTETGEIVQHVGATTQDYTHGYIYEFTQGSTETKEYTTLVQFEATDFQQMRDGVGTYAEVFSEYFPQGINTKLYKTDLSVPVYSGSHNLYIFTDHIQAGDIMMEDNSVWKIESSTDTDDPEEFVQFSTSNPAVLGEDETAILTIQKKNIINNTYQASPIYQTGDGKYVLCGQSGIGGMVLLDETLAPITCVEGYDQRTYDGEEYATWETETITTPSSWTRIDVQPTPLIETDRIESTNKLQSVIATDDNIQAGHYADTTATNAALLLGNGTSSTPHNALVVDWNGNLTASGNITDGQGNTLADLPTKATLGDVLVDGKVVLWDATNQCLVTATTDQLRNLLMWIGTETELRTLKQNDTLEEGKLYATLDNTYFS